MTWSFSNSFIALALMGLATTGSAQHSTADASGFQLGLPVDCNMSTVCSIQKYVDRAQGSERRDYRCGRLTTDAHDGIDFRLRRTQDFSRNVAVVAAAAGKVLRVRDGMADIAVTDPAAPPIGDRMAGNAVVIAHEGGWESQYSHLKRGSVRVHPGETVAAGTPLGAIGMSGNAEFPHLHFEVRRAGKTVDPFASRTLSGCGQAEPGLWSPAAARQLPYHPTELLAAGFAIDPAAAARAHRMLQQPSELIDPSMLILWGTASGVLPQDVQYFRITAPNGGVIFEREIRIEKPVLEWVGFAGLRRPAGGWVEGQYKGSYSLIRLGKMVGTSSTELRVTKVY